MTREEGDRIALVHDNRWLAILGIPLVLFGLAVAIVPWLIDDAGNSGAWPILAVGSLIGAGIITAGLALCFHHVEFIADRSAGTVTRRTGLRPFQRTKTWPLSTVTEVSCVVETMTRSGLAGGSSTHHRMRLTGPNVSVLVASALEPEPIEHEALRWSEFLGKPLTEGSSGVREDWRR